MAVPAEGENGRETGDRIFIRDSVVSGITGFKKNNPSFFIFQFDFRHCRFNRPGNFAGDFDIRIGYYHEREIEISQHVIKLGNCGQVLQRRDYRCRIAPCFAGVGALKK